MQNSGIRPSIPIAQFNCIAIAATVRPGDQAPADLGFTQVYLIAGGILTRDKVGLPVIYGE